MLRWVAVVGLVLLTACGAKEPARPKVAQSIAELRQQLEDILKETKIPGVSVAIVRRDKTEWVAALGRADVANGRPATETTLFRIGSVSKAFASIAILQLAREGKLRLEDPVRKHVPEVRFENRWEVTDPVRVVHLLEHTTGWDDMHLAEYAKEAPDTMTLREGLEYYHGSRISRWTPGTRMSYCNSGPPVAAAIVEKLTGMRFEDYVQRRIFEPIGMRTATFFRPAGTAAAILYHADGLRPFPYWQILLRPAGSVNASALDMAAYLRFYLNRGTVDGQTVLSAAEMDRMEVPGTPWSAQEGLQAGYGLGNYWTVANGFVSHGHQGGVMGGLTDMSYLKEHGVGYFYSVNSGNGAGFIRIGKAIREYVTRDLAKAAVPAATPLPNGANEYEGWYEPDNPRQEDVRFLLRLSGLSYVQFRDGKMWRNAIGSWKQQFVPVQGMQFRRAKPEDAPPPVAQAIVLKPKDEGRFLVFDTEVVRRIPTVVAWLEILSVGFVLLMMLAVIFYAPFWLIAGLWKRRRRPAERLLRVLPLLSVLALIGTMAILGGDEGNELYNFGRVTVWSVALCIDTILIAVFAVASAVVAWRRKEGMRPRVLLFARAAAVALLIATAYLAYWGMVGYRSWI